MIVHGIETTEGFDLLWQAGGIIQSAINGFEAGSPARSALEVMQRMVFDGQFDLNGLGEKDCHCEKCAYRLSLLRLFVSGETHFNENGVPRALAETNVEAAAAQ